MCHRKLKLCSQCLKVAKHHSVALYAKKEILFKLRYLLHFTSLDFNLLFLGSPLFLRNSLRSNTPLQITFLSACEEVPVMTRFVSFATLMKLASSFSLAPLKGAAPQRVTTFSYNTSSYAVLAPLCTRQNILRSAKISICPLLEKKTNQRKAKRGLSLLIVPSCFFCKILCHQNFHMLV